MNTIKNDQYFMKEALKEAKKAFKKGEIPIGAVVVNNLTHKIVSRAHNIKEEENDITGHAEILAIKKAAKKEKNRRLENHTIYVTLEPCVMCMGAILQTRIDRLVFALNENTIGGVGGAIDLTKAIPTNLSIKSGVLIEESKKLLTDFFAINRKKK